MYTVTNSVCLPLKFSSSLTNFFNSCFCFDVNDFRLDFAKKFADDNNIGESDLVIGLNTGAGGRWQDKKLSIAEAAQLIDKLNDKFDDKNIKLILFGGPEEKDRNEKIKGMIKTDMIDAGCDNSLMEFSSLVNLCHILVTSDSLAMHIGTALKKKMAKPNWLAMLILKVREKSQVPSPRSRVVLVR